MSFTPDISTIQEGFAKAILMPVSADLRDVTAIQFMFNPSEMTFEGVVKTDDNAGSRFEKSGKPKVDFSNIAAYKIIIKSIVFDTYESKEDVLEKYINHLKSSVKFIEGKERPPIYRFSWGSRRTYLEYCFVEQLSYRITMFLPDGKPVRAVIDNLVLKETDGLPEDQLSTPKAQSNPLDNIEFRKKNFSIRFFN